MPPDELLRKAMPPVEPAELERDLWPRMRRRIEQERPIRAGWLDWAVAAAAMAWLLAFPQAIPALLYHL